MIEIFGQKTDTDRQRAESLCQNARLAYILRDTADAWILKEMHKRMTKAGQGIVVFIKGHHIGGAAELESAIRSGAVQQIIGGF